MVRQTMCWCRTPYHIKKWYWKCCIRSHTVSMVYHRYHWNMS